MHKYLAELFGTFVLVFLGTGAVIINDTNQGVLGVWGVSSAFGLAVCAMIYIFGKISGAHINPAVSIGFGVLNHLTYRETFLYSIVQILGSLLGSAILLLLFPEHETLGMTIPKAGVFVSFLLEIGLTFLLMLIILLVSQRTKSVMVVALVVGFVVFLEAFFAGDLTGASMNPARSIAPALFAGDLSHIWIYIFAPILGSVLAVKIYPLIP